MNKRISRGGLSLAAVALVAPFAVINAPAPAHADAAPVTVDLQALSAADKAQRISAMQARAGELAKQLKLGDKLVVTDVLVDNDGMQHVRVKRFHVGLEVVNGDMVLDVKPDGTVVEHHATFDKPIVVGMDVALSEAVAQAEAKKAVAKDGAKNVAVQGAAKKVIFIDGQTAKVAHAVAVTGDDPAGIPLAATVYVDAKSGAELATNKTTVKAAGTAIGNSIYLGRVQLDTTVNGGVHELRSPKTGNYVTDLEHQSWDTSRSRGPVGTIVTSRNGVFGDGTGRNEQSAAADAAAGMEITYNAFREVLNRNGYDDRGTGIRSRIHYDRNFANAWWDGTQLTFGDGEAGETMIQLDVMAHELGHGVNSTSANLNYYGDAGGLNEANSDIIGTMVELAANNPEDRPDYQMGEKLNMRGDGSPLRWMDQPSRDNAYDRSGGKYSSPDYYNADVKRMDPHYASGPLNHWFYLASEGTGRKVIGGTVHESRTVDGKQIQGIGWQKASKIWYRALTTKLTAASSYTDARDGVIQSAIELYGRDSNEARIVQRAMDGIAVPQGRVSVPDNGDNAPRPTETPTARPTATPTTRPTSEPTTPVPGDNFDGGLISNGNFVNGSTGWILSGRASVSSAAGLDAGSVSMSYGGMIAQDVKTTSNNKVSLWIKGSASSIKVVGYDKGIRMSYTLTTREMESRDGWTRLEADAWMLRNREVQLQIKATGSVTVDQVSMH